MFFDERTHSGRPHFHAFYCGKQASFDATDMSRLAGKLPVRIERLVRRWARAHRAELNANWERGRNGEQLLRVPPLK
jgi:hypothetical protein